MDPRLLSDSQFDSSLKIISALAAKIVQWDSLFSMTTVEAQRLAKSEVVRVNYQTQADLAASLHQSLPVDPVRPSICHVVNSPGAVNITISTA